MFECTANEIQAALLALENEGYAAATAANGRAALELLDSRTFDTILCDLRMPEMDGMTFLKHARDRKIDATIIVMSAFGTMDQALETILRIDNTRCIEKNGLVRIS